MKPLLLITLLFLACPLLTSHVEAAEDGPLRVLFLGHERGTHKGHDTEMAHRQLSAALGPDAIYFDYHTSVERTFGDADYLNRFDVVLLYGNHRKIQEDQWANLKNYVENGGGFVPVHSASACFGNEPEFHALIGGRFASHKSRIFQPKTILPDHAAIRNVAPLEAWDETYRHKEHNSSDRTILQVREVSGSDDNITEPEPWTWIRTQGEGRVFYTASGHDERVWSQDAFHELLHRGIVWAAGESRRQSYEAFLSGRTPLKYERRDNVPNYEKRPEPLLYQFPLSPEDSMDYIKTPIDFRLELFASEPQIVNPINMTWDERGRLWVAETVDYPNEITEDRAGRDSIKILEDTDGDGRCDKVTIFAAGLNVPTSLTFANGGVIVAQAPDFLFLKDTDGDDVADVREVINTGWGIRDTHAGPSNLRYGFDNQIWGSVGYSGYTDPDGASEKFGSGLFKMDRDGSQIRFLHQFNNNTWGLGFDSTGLIFGSSANNNPAFFGGFPRTGYGKENGRSAAAIADTAQFYPITHNVRQVDAYGKYTSAAGFSLATSDNFPDSWRGRRAFVCGPTGHLLGMYQTTPVGAGFRADTAYSLLASADEWFSPVASEIGPDGNLWVADWYNFIIQHNPTPTIEEAGYEAERGKGAAHINPNRDAQHGRIYRVIWEKAKEPKIRSLEGASPEELIAALDDSNMFWRLTAQRLLVEGAGVGSARRLKEKVLEGGIGAVHALWALKGIGLLDKETHQAALLQADSVLKRNAIDAIEETSEGAQLFFDTAVVTSKDLQVRRAAFSKLAHFPENDTVKAALPALFRDQTNREGEEWLELALDAAAINQGVTGRGLELGPNLLENSSFETLKKDGTPIGWKTRIKGDSNGIDLSVVDDKGAAKSGNQFLQITSKAGGVAMWQTTVAVEPDTDYQVAGWVRTPKISAKRTRGVALEIPEIGGARSRVVKVRKDWVELNAFFNSGDKTKITVSCLFGADGSIGGVAFFDDVSLSKLSYTESSEGQLTGDPARGKTIFHENAIASCIRCHQVGGEGGIVGPALDGIGSLKDGTYLRESLVDPQAAIAEGYPAEVSPMPPFGVLLSKQEIEDLVSYMKSLEAKTSPK